MLASYSASWIFLAQIRTFTQFNADMLVNCYLHTLNGLSVTATMLIMLSRRKREINGIINQYLVLVLLTSEEVSETLCRCIECMRHHIRCR